MKRSILLTFLLAGGIASSYAQENNAADNSPSGPMFEHQVGVQMNELIRQVFNFNSTATVTPTNPFLLTYTMTHAKTNFGFRLGVGYIQRGFVDDDGVTSRNGTINDVNFRLGVEKSFVLSKRWSAGAGADFVYASNKNETKSIIRSVDSTIVNTKNTVSNQGGGAMAWLRYHISKNVLVGTETSFYYRKGKIKGDVEITQTTQFPLPQSATINSSTNVDQSEGILSIPTVFYLIVKF